MSLLFIFSLTISLTLLTPEESAFIICASSDSFLVMPAGLSTQLEGQIRDRGVTPVPADVSEFLKKGGGSVKCMIGDLGVIADGG